MKIKLDSPDQLGELVRATRKHQFIRQDLLAEILGVSENFMGRLENGADTVQWGKLFKVLEALGIEVIVDLPEGAEKELVRRAKKTGSP
ncbi:helix-turn-helix domain-containing protein [Silvimonas amylolytica]|nr:helix-turn-helix domain-containing protein [Silvimonas amylolytica]